MNITYRIATKADIDKLLKLRIDYLTEDRGYVSNNDKEAVLKQLKEYYAKSIGNSFFAVLAEKDNEIIATAFLVISEKPANPAFITGKIGTVLNVFTYPEHRKQGVATTLLNTIIEISKQKDLSFIELSATKSGKPLYEKLGFLVKQSNYTEMKLTLHE